jgi:hypothetical protein
MTMPISFGPSQAAGCHTMGSVLRPAHNLDLLPYNLHVFGLLQKILKGHTLVLDEYVKEVVAQWLKQQSTEFFSDVIC